MTGNLYLRLETSDSLAEYFGIQEIMKGKMKTPEELKKEIEKVTPQDIQKVAREIFKDDRLNLAIVGNISNPNSLKKILKLPSVKN
jgi:predicted Zn-dependent peptidase